MPRIAYPEKLTQKVKINFFESDYKFLRSVYPNSRAQGGAAGVIRELVHAFVVMKQLKPDLNPRPELRLEEYLDQNATASRRRRRKERDAS